MGVIAVETRGVERFVPADPSNPESREMKETMGGKAGEGMDFADFMVPPKWSDVHLEFQVEAGFVSCELVVSCFQMARLEDSRRRKVGRMGT